MGRRLAWLWVAVVLCGCTPAAHIEDPLASGVVAEQPVLEGSLLQFRRDAEARRIQVRLTAAREGMVVTSLALVADGFSPPPLRQRTTTLPAGRPLDLELTLTSPDCAGTPTSVVARVSVAGTADPVDVPLENGELLRRLHDAECADRALLDQVRIEVVSLQDAPGGGVLRATVRFTRVSGGDAVRIAGVDPNTVYGITPVGDLPTLVGDGSVDLVLDLAPTRCDVHALGESYRTSLIDLRVSLGDAEPRPFVLAPDDAVRRAIESFAVDTCLGGQ